MKQELKKILKEKGIFPKKSLGQNFLISKAVFDKILATANLQTNEIVLEIGAGTGTLTKKLAEKAKKVIAVEKDRRMIELLNEELKGFENVEIVEGDILNFQFSKLKNYKLIANLPYYIAAPVIRMFLEAKNPPQLMVLMIQKEVAQRICSSPPEMSKIAVFSQFYGKPEIISYVSKNSFWPSPKVDSAILKIIPRKPFLKKKEIKIFSKIVSAGFSHPRKQLPNNLSKELNLLRQKVENWLINNDIDPKQRAETLKVDDWINLTKSIEN